MVLRAGRGGRGGPPRRVEATERDLEGRYDETAALGSPGERMVGIEVLDAVGDPSAAQKVAGHSIPATTARYDRCGDRVMRLAGSHLHVPHFGKHEGSR